MKAKIFSLENQRRLRLDIERSLRRILYQNIECEHEIYDDQYEHVAKAVGRSYLELMRASTVSVGSFTIAAEYEEGSYYWYTEGDYLLRLSQELKDLVFPTVAIMDHMVMVPRGIHQAFELPSEFAYIFRPRDVRGAVLADFGSKEAIDKAVLRVTAQIKTDIVSLARRHMSVQGIRLPDLEELSRLLDVDQEFLEGLTQDIMGQSHHLVTEVTSGKLRLNKESRVTLLVRNESADALGTVRMQIRAPVPVMEEPLIRYLDFSPGKPDHQAVEFDLQPQAVPFCPLEVLFLIEDASDDVLPPVALILEVTGP